MASYGIACLLLFGTIPLVNGDGCNATLAVTSSSATQSAKTGSGLCTWTFETQEPKSLVSLEIVNVSLSVGPSCTTNNSIVIYDGDLTGPIMGIVCESYMKIVSVHNTIVLQYSADLVKTEDSFSVMFNSIPDPLQYVQVRFLDTHLTPYDETRVQVVDGILPSGYVLGRVNLEQTPTFEGAEESISLQFSTGLYQYKGFLLEYKQVKDHFPLRRFWSPDFLKGKFSSPKYPYGKVRDMDAVWTISSINDYNHILLAFETVDLGDENNCSDNFITVYNGNMSHSGTRKTTLCGKERGAFLALGGFLTVVLKTDNTTSKKGFVANYTNDHFEGCTGTVKVVSIYDSSHIQTPNYPYMYPRNMNCSYQLVAIEQSKLLSLKIEEMGMGDSNCQKDYVEIFDGPSPSSKSLGRYCGDKMGTVSSSGKQMFVRFVSGRKGGGIGCKINIDTVNNDKTPLIIGLSTGGAFLGFLLMLALIVFIERRRQKRSGNALL